MNYDYLIVNAEVIDGSGTIGQKQDVAICGKKIVAVGQLSRDNADTVIDADGLILAPGFIDVHTHDDLEVLRNPGMLNKVSQGVTSVIIGNCGISASPYQSKEAPVDPINLLGQQSEFVFPQLIDFINAFEKISPNVNVAALVGHTSLRAQVMDNLDRAATASEMQKMVELLNVALSQGALGLSSGLAYKNAYAAPTEEVALLVKQLKAFDAIYTTHIRTEFDGIIGALDEAFDVAKAEGVQVVISHLKCAGKANWGRADEIISHIKDKQKSQKISCDCYPYNASSSTLDLQQVTEDFEVFITWSEPHPEKSELNLSEIATQWQVSLMEAAKRLQPAGAVYHGMDENDVRKFLSFPSSMIGSDGLPCDPHPHPRLWGAFPRVLGHYSREESVLDLSTAVHKMTGLSATEFGLSQRGFIREGYYADIVLFDAKTIKDMASFTEPFAQSRGIESVWVNGQLTYQSGKLSVTECGAGQFLAH